MSKHTRLRLILNIIVILALLLSACSSAEQPEPPSIESTEPPAVEQTEAPEPEQVAESTESIESTEAPAAPPVKGDRYQHITGAFEMPGWGEVADEGSDYAFLESDLGNVLVIVSSNRDELDENSAIDEADSALQNYLVGLEMLSAAQIQSVNNGYLLRYDGETASGDGAPGLIYLRQDGSSRYYMILLAPDVAAAEGDFVALAEGFVPNPTVKMAETAEADSGFRPEEYGFSFPNYGDDIPAVNMTPDEMQRMFGDQVCASQAGGACTLTPAAQRWMDQINTSMKGGHCEGLAVLSSLMYYGQIDPNSFGAPIPNALSINDNEALQRELAYWFATQYTSPGGQGKINESPAAVVEVLIDAFADGQNAGEYYSVGVYKSDFSGGHAVTPVAVDDKGDGLYDILVYDNNMPNQLRAIHVDVNANTWQYSASINPAEQEDLYEGDADTHTLEIVSITPRLGEQFCEFCSSAAITQRAGAGVAAPIIEYIEVWLEGPADLLITDEQGRRIGYENGEFLNEIPDAQTERVKLGVDVWDANNEPVYRIPAASTFTITVDGSRLTEMASSAVSVIGAGWFLAVDDISLEPGEIDNIGISGDGKTYAVVYQTNYTETPEVYLGIETEAADYAFLVQATELTGEEDTLNIAIDMENQVLALTTSGNTEPGTFDFYVLRIDDSGEAAFGTSGYSMQPNASLYLLYSEWPGPGTPMQAWLDTNDDGEPDETFELPDTSDEFEW
jgi:hypothetical protein